jgi:hypothetical protein
MHADGRTSSSLASTSANPRRLASTSSSRASASSRPSSQVFLFEPNDRLFLRGRWRMERPVPLLDAAEVTLAFQEINDDRRTQDLGGSTQTLEENRSRVGAVIFQTMAHWRELMKFTAGMDVYLDWIASSARERDLGTGQVTRGDGRFADGSRSDSLGWFLEDEVTVYERLTAVLGPRLSHFMVDIASGRGRPGTRLDVTDLTGNQRKHCAFARRHRVRDSSGSVIRPARAGGPSQREDRAECRDLPPTGDAEATQQSIQTLMGRAVHDGAGAEGGRGGRVAGRVPAHYDDIILASAITRGAIRIRTWPPCTESDRALQTWRGQSWPCRPLLARIRATRRLAAWPIL